MKMPVLPIKGVDQRMTKYENIAKVHKDIVEAKWRAQTTNTPFRLAPTILLHLEDSVAFLAEEFLKLRVAVDDIAKIGESVLQKVDDGMKALEEKAQETVT